MNPAVIVLITKLVEQLVVEAPQVYAELQTLLSKPNPSPDDWAALRMKILGESFSTLAPDAPVQ